MDTSHVEATVNWWRSAIEPGERRFWWWRAHELAADIPEGSVRRDLGLWSRDLLEVALGQMVLSGGSRRAALARLGVVRQPVLPRMRDALRHRRAGNPFRRSWALAQWRSTPPAADEAAPAGAANPQTSGS